MSISCKQEKLKRDLLGGRQRELNKDERLAVWGLGISGEAGEVSDHIKKFIRDDDYCMTPERTDKLLGELGDVLWYVSSIAGAIGSFSLKQWPLPT